MIPYEALTHILFHTSGEMWLELGIAEGRQNLIPANILAEGTVVYLKIDSKFIADKLKAFKIL